MANHAGATRCGNQLPETVRCTTAWFRDRREQIGKPARARHVPYVAFGPIRGRTRETGAKWAKRARRTPSIPRGSREARRCRDHSPQAALATVMGRIVARLTGNTPFRESLGETPRKPPVASPVGLLATIAPSPPIYASAESRKTDGSDCLEFAITALRSRNYPVCSSTCRLHAQNPPSPPATLNPKRRGSLARKAYVNASLAARGRMGRVHASRNVRELALFRNPAEALKLASFRNHASVDVGAATTPAQDWLRSAITLLCTRRRLRARIGFVPQLRLRGPGAGSDPGLASFRNYGSVDPAAAPGQNWLRSAISLPCTRRRLRPRIGFVPQLRLHAPGGGLAGRACPAPTARPAAWR
jgi:hypothetical protein